MISNQENDYSGSHKKTGSGKKEKVKKKEWGG